MHQAPLHTWGSLYSPGPGPLAVAAASFHLPLMLNAGPVPVVPGALYWPGPGTPSPCCAAGSFQRPDMLKAGPPRERLGLKYWPGPACIAGQLLVTAGDTCSTLTFALLAPQLTITAHSSCCMVSSCPPHYRIRYQAVSVWPG